MSALPTPAIFEPPEALERALEPLRRRIEEDHQQHEQEA